MAKALSERTTPFLRISGTWRVKNYSAGPIQGIIYDINCMQGRHYETGYFYDAADLGLSFQCGLCPSSGYIDLHSQKGRGLL